VRTKLDFHELGTVFRCGDLPLREDDVMVGAAGLRCFLRIKEGEAPMDVLQHTHG